MNTILLFFPLLLLPVDTPDTQQMASVQPQFPSTSPGLPLLRGSPSPPHTQLWSTAGLVPGQMKTHTITHGPLLGRRGGKSIPALIGQLTQSCVWNFFIWTQLEIFKWDSVKPDGKISLRRRVFPRRTLHESGQLIWDEAFLSYKNTVCSLKTTRGLNVVMWCPVTRGQALNLTASLEMTLEVGVSLVELK